MRQSRARRGVSVASVLVGAVALSPVLAAIAIWYLRAQACCPPPPMVAAGTDAAPPADFSIVVDGHTGTVSPPFYHRYRLSITRDSLARYRFMPGYPENGPAWDATFVVTNAQRTALWSQYETSALSTTPPAPTDPAEPRSVGGGFESVVVVASGHTVTLNTDRSDAWAGRIRQFVSDVLALTPDSISTRMRERQAAWADSMHLR
jgi:hypothetical protein